jgi:quercetin dioxygenase-like cupin family protein
MAAVDIPKQTFEQFTAQAMEQGFDQTLVREWNAHQVNELHQHPFDTSALVVRGEFWLTVDGQTTHLKAGDRFALGRNIDHSERYGPEGATFWAARRN